MYLFHAQSTLSRRSNVQQPVVGVWSCENKVRKRVEVKSKILQSSGKKALKTSLVPRYTVKSGSSAAKLGRSSRAKADSTCSHSVLSALMLLLLPSLEAEEPVFTVYLGSPLIPYLIKLYMLHGSAKKAKVA